jgi:hypothetical protein
MRTTDEKVMAHGFAEGSAEQLYKAGYLSSVGLDGNGLEQMPVLEGLKI